MDFSDATATANNLATNGRDADIRELAAAIAALATATDRALRELMTHVKRAEHHAAESERIIRQVR